MKSADVVASLGALAHERRLAIYRLLIRRGPEGLPAGAIGERVGLGPSSLTFHLQGLQRAGLVRQVRDGRQLIYSADFEAMNGLVSYLSSECCASASTSASVIGCGPPRAGTRRRPARAMNRPAKSNHAYEP